jgi:lipopolysaccharide/colanic/teichoic acid biosynthesis glycosyltransferase
MYGRFFKRPLDLLLSLLALPPVLLAVLVAAAAIYLDDPGPVFYNAPRRGLNGKVYTMYKLRSMRVGALPAMNEDGSAYCGARDPRITRVGRILRKLSVDELPQILNILKGDMSFVGPRPNLARNAHPRLDEIGKKRLTVRPGMTGYSQAYYRNSISQQQKFLNDCYYADHVGFLLDVKIVLRTLGSVVRREGVYADQDGGAKRLKSKGAEVSK